MEEFHKIRRLPPYVFEQVNRLKASARARGADIIDLGMGNPDLPTPKAIVDKLNGALNGALSDPSVSKIFIAQGATIQKSTPEELRQLVIHDVAKWKKVVADSGMVAN